tara:strand:+ start:167 stop:1063 length:897 start_codon:yes stop_codon:yes gene_type:complete
MKKSLLILIIFISNGVFSQHPTSYYTSLAIANVKHVGEKIVIKYNFSGRLNEKYELNLFVKQDGDSDWQGPLIYVTGDIGKDQLAGFHKTVTWDVLKERDKFLGDWIFGIEIAEKDMNFFVDRRDGKKYKTVKIGNQTWMAENLAYACKYKGSYFAYENNNLNVPVHGYLYDAVTAQEVCPILFSPQYGEIKWRLPSDSDWHELVNYLGGKEIAVNKMKSDSGWVNNNNGNNSSGFNGLPSGVRTRDGDFYVIGEAGYWWTSTKKNEYEYWNRGLFDEVVIRNGVYWEQSFSVRCIKD